MTLAIRPIHPALMEALRRPLEKVQEAKAADTTVPDALVKGIKDRDVELATHKARIGELEAQLARVQAELSGAAERAQNADTARQEASEAARIAKEESTAHRFRAGQMRIDLHTEREARARAEAALAEMEKRLVATEQRLEKATSELMEAIQSIPQPAPMVMPELPAPPKHWMVKVATRDAAGVVRSLKITPSED
jgi:chromosome segregation ATPase